MKLEAQYPELADPIEEFSDSVGTGVRQLAKIFEDNSSSDQQFLRVDFRQGLKSGIKKSLKVWGFYIKHIISK